MKERLSIGAYAKHMGVTAETLRHYDRIGLFKPVSIDKQTGYRYYSILQDEKLGTIMDLRKLGMSIDDIKGYFKHHNVSKSLEMLKDEHRFLRDKISELIELEGVIKSKIDSIEGIYDELRSIGKNKVFFKNIEDRYILQVDRPIHSDIDFTYGLLELDGIIEEIAPLLANNNIGTIVDKDEVDYDKEERNIYNVFMFIDEDRYTDYKDYRKKLEGGLYICMYTNGPTEDLIINLRKLRDMAVDMGYEIVGDCIEFNKIDASVTNKNEEQVFELQIPIKKC